MPKGGDYKYDSKICDRVRMMAEKGLTDTEMCDLLGLQRQTFWRWKKKHPDFAEAMEEGKALSDQYVEQSLYHRAKGFEREEEVVFCSKGVIVKTKVMKYYPPDTTACIYWTKNRMPSRGRDRNVIEHEGNITVVTTNSAGASANAGHLTA